MSDLARPDSSQSRRRATAVDAGGDVASDGRRGSQHAGRTRGGRRRAADGVCPPLISFTVFFCVMHSLRHLVRAAQRQGDRPGRSLVHAAAWPMAGTVGAAVRGWASLESRSLDQAMMQLVFVGLAALTVPHMVLVEAAARAGWPRARKALVRATFTSTSPRADGGVTVRTLEESYESESLENVIDAARTIAYSPRCLWSEIRTRRKDTPLPQEVRASLGRQRPPPGDEVIERASAFARQRVEALRARDHSPLRLWLGHRSSPEPLPPPGLGAARRLACCG